MLLSIRDALFKFLDYFEHTLVSRKKLKPQHIQIIKLHNDNTRNDELI
jgi:hypothetical protein